jgi:hypothetical protein
MSDTEHQLEKIEEEIKAEVGVHPLAQVTLKDITKGFIGFIRQIYMGLARGRFGRGRPYS